MIKFEHTEVIGWEHAIRGMRNPMNSWERSDTSFCTIDSKGDCRNPKEFLLCEDCDIRDATLGPNDHDLMMRLRNAGTDHRKFMRMITVYVDITAPLYWWKEFDTYKVGTVANSCSTMHKIAAKEFTIDDFSCEHLMDGGIYILKSTIDMLNKYRLDYLNPEAERLGVKKKYWWQMIQLLPSSYNQKRTVMLNYEVLANMYNGRVRTPHKLDEWRVGFAEWVESLPYSEIITGFKDEKHKKLVEDIDKILVTNYPTADDFIDKWNDISNGYPILKEVIEKLIDPSKRASEVSRTMHDIMDKLNSEGE